MSFPTFDTAQTGKPVTATGQVFDFGAPVSFYLTLASYMVQGQGVGPVAVFQLLGGSDSGKFVTVNYGDVTPPQKFNATTLVCTAITGSVQVRVIISADPQSIDPQTVGTVTSSGATTIKNNVSVSSTGYGTLYTCPANSKAHVIRFGLIQVTGSPILIAVAINGAYLITPTGGYSLPSGQFYTAGPEPNDNIILTVDVLLLPGDTFEAVAGASGVGINFEILQEPL